MHYVGFLLLSHSCCHSIVNEVAGALHAKLKHAITQSAKQTAEFHGFQLTIPAASIAEWTEAIENWEKDEDELNPFQTTAARESVLFLSLCLFLTGLIIALTSATVRLRLAEEDDARQGDDPVILHQDITPSMLILKGLELEDNQ